MIKPDAALSIKLIPISCLQVKEEKWRYQHTVDGYVRLLNVRPQDYLGFLSVTPSDTHPGMYCLLDGHHRYIAYVIAGRHDALCVIIEEVDEDEHALGEERISNETAAIGTASRYAPVGTQSAGWHGLSCTAKGNASTQVTPLEALDGASQSTAAERRH